MNDDMVRIFERKLQNVMTNPERQAAGSPEQNQAINQDVKDRFLERAKHQWRGSQCKLCGAFRINHAPDSDCFVQKKIFRDAEAMAAMRYLMSRGYTSEEIVEEWWRMERLDTSNIEHCRENG